ncbi:MAG: hypothetical protein SCM11_04480 [Bacillota bacterium]|nr:hypothetical protein [Bacillota bacterium]
MAVTNSNIRYTTVLPVKDVEELKKLAAQKVISSVNNGIREAIEMFLEKAKNDHYAQEMAEASRDKRFMERTIHAQSDFEHADSEVSGQW